MRKVMLVLAVVACLAFTSIAGAEIINEDAKIAIKEIMTKEQRQYVVKLLADDDAIGAFVVFMGSTCYKNGFGTGGKSALDRAYRKRELPSRERLEEMALECALQFSKEFSNFD